MAIKPAICPKCDKRCLYDLNEEYYRCLHCQQDYDKVGQRIAHAVYSTEFFNLTGVKTQAQIIAKKRR